MYPGTIFEWVDNSAIPVISETEDDTPLFLTAFASGRGSEDPVIVKGDTFYKLYGDDISFTKYGQPLLQASRIIDAGGKLYCKRVVAPDSKLANIILCCKLSEGTKQKSDPVTGKPLYIQDDGTTISDVVSSTPVMESVATLKWTAHSVQDATFFDEVNNLIESPTMYAPEGVEEEDSEGNKVTVYKYPLFVVTENGRGTSTKKLQITADYALSKNLDFTMYNFTFINGTDQLETTRFTADPDVIYNKQNMSISNMCRLYLKQGKVKSDESIMTNFIKKLSEISGMNEEEVRSIDFLFGKNRKGLALSNIIVDDDSLDISSIYGVDLLNGDNGSFGEYPLQSDDYSKSLCDFFGGVYTDDIYDRDTYKLAACFDANYPEDVKRKIEELAIWREDFVFFEDIGLNMTTYEGISVAASEMAKSTFIAGYLTSYDVEDPYTLKQISVTMMYSLAPIMVDHIRTKAYVPTAGIANEFIISEAIEGTVNFLPKITPTVNQKTLLEDDRINYASYIEGQLVVESLYTTQQRFTQLSFVNNVLAVQEVARAVRTYCPRNRYKFIDGSDLESYKKGVQEVLNPFGPNFKTLNFVYVEDPVMVSNKIFKAALEFRFYNFAQTEIFTLFALGDEEENA